MTSTTVSPPEGTLLGRAVAEGWPHPALVTVRGGRVFDITAKAAPTSRDVCEMDDPAGYVAAAPGREIGPVAALLENSMAAGRDPAKPICCRRSICRR